MTAPDPGDPRVVLGLEEHAVGVLVEVRDADSWASASTTMLRNLRHSKSCAVAADAGLAEEHRTAVVQLDQQPRTTSITGDASRAAQGGADEVEGALAGRGRPRGSAAARRARAAGRRPGACHPARRDVAEARHDGHLHVVALEVPGDPAEVGRRREGALGEEHEVGLGGEASEAVSFVKPMTGTPPRGLLDRPRGRHQGADDPEAQPLLAAQDAGDLVDPALGPGDDHLRQQAPAAVQAVDDPAGRPPPQQQQRHADEEEQDEEDPRELELRQVAGDPDGAGREAGSAEHPGVLDGADPEMGLGVGAPAPRWPASRRRRSGPTDRATVLTSFATGGRPACRRAPDGGERRRPHDDDEVTGRDPQLEQPMPSSRSVRGCDHRSRAQSGIRSQSEHGWPHVQTNPPPGDRNSPIETPPPVTLRSMPTRSRRGQEPVMDCRSHCACPGRVSPKCLTALEAGRPTSRASGPGSRRTAGCGHRAAQGRGTHPRDPRAGSDRPDHRRAQWPALRRLAPARSWTRAATRRSRSRSVSTTARSPAPPSRPAPRPAPSRRPSAATATRAATSARASSRPSTPSSSRSTRGSSASTRASSGSSTPR